MDRSPLHVSSCVRSRDEGRRGRRKRGAFNEEGCGEPTKAGGKEWCRGLLDSVQRTLLGSPVTREPETEWNLSNLVLEFQLNVYLWVSSILVRGIYLAIAL